MKNVKSLIGAFILVGTLLTVAAHHTLVELDYIKNEVESDDT